ncbi:MAG: alpha/beta fold hydrolase [Bacillota bacterium]|nr:alpha/beta fold hydrolase [Bacillota bacterium]
MTDPAPGITPITLHDVLDIKYLGKWDWSPCGRHVAWLHDAGGITDLWIGSPDLDCPGGAPRQLTSAKDTVSDFAWRPAATPAAGTAAAVAVAAPAAASAAVAVAGPELAVVVDGELWLAAPDGLGWFALRRLVVRKDRHGGLAWSRDGQTLTYSCGGGLFAWDAASGETRQCTIPGRLLSGFAARAAVWAPDGSCLAFGFENEDRVPQVGVVDRSGALVWRSHGSDPAGGPAWIGSDLLMYRIGRKYNTEMELHLLKIAGAGAPAAGPAGLADTPRATSSLLFRTTGEGKGSGIGGPPAPSPDGRHALLLLEEDGWAHHYLYSRDTGRLEQVTFGECEDFGHAGDEPAWSPDGRSVVYSSNRAALSYRHLWLLDIGTKTSRQLTSGLVTDVQPRFSRDGARLAFVHCDVYRNMDIWVAPLGEPASARQLSHSMPAAWTPANQIAPEEVTYQGALDWTIHAQLYRPHGWSPDDASTRYPALVWVHGGPVRQMRPGWHPMHSYAFFHAYHQYLLQRGYVVLVINFRGGIGYGRDFRHGLYHKMGIDDVTDVVGAGRFLKSLPYVDPARVAVWGLSYGGYMTLHCLTQYPEEFAMGINVAGIWDFAQWTRWAESRQGKTGGLFQAFLGGSPDENPELYRQASPCTFRDGLARPLISLHGTNDANVDFAQLDRIVLDCVKLGKDYEAFYYPSEVHTFRHKHTWLDAFPKIEREFAKRLKPGS